MGHGDRFLPPTFGQFANMIRPFFRKYRDDSSDMKKRTIINLAITDIDAEWTG